MTGHTDVYWSAFVDGASQTSLDLLFTDLVRLQKDLRQDLKDDPLLKCPSFMREIKGTYVVKSPFDFRIEYNPDIGNWVVLFGDLHSIIPSDQSRFVQLHNFLSFAIFSSGKDVEMQVMPPYMHNFPAPSIVGSFDISKWFRPVSPTFLLDKGRQYSFKQGDALCYIKFNQTVRLKRFYMNDKIRGMMQSAVDVKLYTPQRALDYLYRLFVQSGMNSRILAEIERSV